MAVVQFHCPHCAGLFQVDDSLAGEEVTCPLCEGLIILPAADAFAPPELDHDAPPPPPDVLPMGTAVGYAASDEMLPSGSLPMGAVPSGSVPMGSVPMGSVPMGSVPMGSVPMGSVPMGELPPEFVPTGSLPPDSLLMGNVPMGTVPMGALPDDLAPPPLPHGFDVPPEFPVGALPTGSAVPAGFPPDLEPFPPTGSLPTDLLPPGALPTGTFATEFRAAAPSSAPQRGRTVPQRPQPMPGSVSNRAPVSGAPISTAPNPNGPVPGVPGAAALDPMAPLGAIAPPLEKPAPESPRDPDEIVDTRQKVKIVGTGVGQRELRKLSPEEKARRTRSRTITTLVFCLAMLLITMLLVMWREAVEKRDAEGGSEVLQRSTNRVNDSL